MSKKLTTEDFINTSNGYDVEFKFFDSSILKSKLRVFLRDFNFKNLGYIEKQFEQYQKIKEKYETKTE